MLFTILLLLGFTTTTLGQNQISSVNLKTLDGQVVDLMDFLDDADVTVLSFWATWCKPCQAELDNIADLYPDWQSEYNAQIIAITIDTQRALAKVAPLVNTKGWEYIILSDANNQMRNILNFQAIPQTYIVDAEGNVLWSHTGYVPGNEYELEDKIAEFAGGE
jgi:peroxiredoxin